MLSFCVPVMSVCGIGRWFAGRLGAILIGVSTFGLCGSSVVSAEDQAPKFSREHLDYFEKKIRPVLIEHCYKCHSAEAKDVEGGLLLDSRAGVIRGGDSGPAVVPGDANASLLIQAVRYGEDSSQMPPAGKLPQDVIADLEHWVAIGLPDPRSGAAPETAPSSASSHWAFQPPQTVPLPAIARSTWPSNELDYFVLARLEANGIQPSPEANRATLIRRLYFNLLGLPPTVEQVEAFENDRSEEAYEQLVDTLLDSLQFGQRWARHWLDVARYADTKGYVFTADRNYRGAYRYRDWVVQSLNDDMPYDQFVVQQLAADRLPEDERSLAALGFLTLGRRFLNNTHDIIDDRIDVVSRGLMGLTVACARCHHHKYDPIKMDDYYSLYGVFASSQESDIEGLPPQLTDKSNPHDARIFLRGQPGNPGPIVPRQFLEVLSQGGPRPLQEGSGRLELARAIVDPDNPVTSRVMVNRVWGHLFGKGLVDTPSDFGTRSDPPSHPQLLDFLARQFVESGWSRKKLIRLIVTSRTFRQASIDRREAAALDPENRLLWRMNRRRLDFEAMRDSLLAAAGTLDRSIGGPAVDITQQPYSTRRTIYGSIDRQNLPGLFRAFDFANPDTHSPRRYETSVPQQSLYLLNNPFVMEQASHVVQRVNGEDNEPQQKIRRLYRTVLGREPDDDELAWSLAFVKSDDANGTSIGANAWRYGYGALDADGNRLAEFHPLTKWTGSRWQGGEQLPDPKTGWVFLSADGGHPGNDLQHSAIRRWIAPHDGVVDIDGTLRHPAEQPDGVRGLIVASPGGTLGRWDVHHGEAATKIENVKVRRGDSIDFVTQCKSNPNHDSFHWHVAVTFRATDVPGKRWDSKADFSGPAVGRPDAWQRLAHVLLISNEFQFVD